MHTTSKHRSLKNFIKAVLFLVAIVMLAQGIATIIATGTQAQQRWQEVTQRVTEAGG